VGDIALSQVTERVAKGGDMPAKTSRMDEVTLARAWIDWLVDTRTGYMDSLLRLPEPELRKDRGASFPSLRDIFLHILDNNVWWLESIPQNRQESHSEVKGPLTKQEIQQQVERVAGVGRELAKSLTPTRLNESFVVRGVQGNGKPYEMKVNLRTIIWHLVEEELQHRGEINALLWQIDVDAPTRSWFSSSLAE
jgi:uncharacterized damage-inducible protein DinB